MPGPPATPPNKTLVVLAFALLYIVWGSTYLGIKIAGETMPAWPMIGARHLLAGSILFTILRLSGVDGPRREHWIGGIVGGVLLLVMGNGMAAYTSHRLPSSVTSLVVATTPIWIVATASLRPGGRPPLRNEWLGLALGLVGLCLLAGPSAAAAIRGDAGTLDAGAIGLVLLGCISWSIGSVIGREMKRPANALMGAATQMLSAGAFLSVACLVTGQWQTVHLAAVSSRSWMAFAFLVICGSVLAFTAYIWLLGVAKTSRVATYAYVNPVVAMLLGATLGHEAITPMMLIAGAVTVLGVVLVVMPTRATD